MNCTKIVWLSEYEYEQIQELELDFVVKLFFNEFPHELSVFIHDLLFGSDI